MMLREARSVSEVSTRVNILLVDDRPENLFALEAALNDLDENLVKANSGEQALRCVLNQDFAVILLDVQMPSMDGFETAGLIREREKSRLTPIIFLTAFDKNDEQILRGYSTGAVDFLFKPIMPGILRAKVNTFVDLYRKTQEVEAQARQIRQATYALQEAHDKLEMRVKERTADLEAANEELIRFTYIVSHDFRAPLINLKGFAAELASAIETIQEQISGLPGLPEEQGTVVVKALEKDIPEALHFIAVAVDRLDHLTNAILRLSRLGRRELNFERIDMNALVKTILDSLAHQIRQQQVAINVGQLPEAIADRTAMEQIMANILNNAVLYLCPDRPGQIEITGENSAKEAVFHVRDNGRGIAEEDNHKIFEPFRRAGKQDVPGEGMGLAYVLALVRRHGGRIWYTSQPGVGTTFSFSIPRTPKGDERE
ncbi:MAG: sensor histidine kinase [Aggregatilineales bacterium]